VQIIHDGKGTHFDPHMIEAFVLLRKTFKEIA
jgi:response regulator RpfG family c-di-GMP phosphodiesterase